MIRRVVSGLSQLAVTIGVILLLFVVYQAWVTDIFAAHRQEQVSEELRDQWAQDPPVEPAEPDLGDGVAFLHIPAFGTGWTRAVVQGVDPEELEAAPGHYPGSAMPGEIGNFAMAGHRVGTGSPFLELDTLGVGDPIVVETADTWFVYRVTESEVVAPTATEVVHPVPDGPADAIPTQSYLTITTCHPRFSARQRLVVHALLDVTVPKADSPDGPAALEEVA
jgi:sortase A